MNTQISTDNGSTQATATTAVTAGEPNPATSAAIGATVAAAAAPPTAPPAAGPPTISPPPPTATVPAVPLGFVAPTGARYGGLLPRASELVALPGAVTDLEAFATYAQTLGPNAPPYAEVLQLFDIGNAWTEMRRHTQAWGAYVVNQEAIAWRAIRLQMGLLLPVFKQAVARNPSLLTQFPSLTAFLTARQTVAKKAVATKAANKKALAAGQPAAHGNVGKARQKKAAKALLAAANGGGSTTVHPPTPVTPTGGAAGAGSQPPLHS